MVGSCAEADVDDVTTPDVTAQTKTISIYAGSSSKVDYTDNGEEGVSYAWVDGDSFSIFEGSGDTSGSTFENSTAEVNSFTGEVTDPLDGATTMYGIFPAQSGTTDLAAVPHSLADQTLDSDGKVDMLTSNFLVASDTYTNMTSITYTFKQTLAMFKVVLNFDAGVETTDIAKVVYSGFSNAGTYNVVTGEWNSGLTKGDITITAESFTVSEYKLTTYMMLFPETVVDPTVKVYNSTGDIIADGTLTGTCTFAKATRYDDVEITVSEYVNPDNTFVAASVEDNSVGTAEETPIVITTREDFVAFYTHYNANYSTYYSTTPLYIQFAQDAVIDMDGVSYATYLGTNANPFIGYIDGNGATIKNLVITPETNRAGLIGRFKSGSIKDITVEGSITIEGSSFTGTNYYGGIIGEVTSTSDIVSMGGTITSKVDISVDMNEGAAPTDTYAHAFGGVVGFTANNATYGLVLESSAVLVYGDESDKNNADKGIRVNVGAGTIQCAGGIIGKSQSGMTNGGENTGVTFKVYSPVSICSGYEFTLTAQTHDQCLYAGAFIGHAALNYINTVTKDGFITGIDVYGDVTSEFTGTGQVDCFAATIGGMTQSSNITDTVAFPNVNIYSDYTASSSSSVGCVVACTGYGRRSTFVHTKVATITFKDKYYYYDTTTTYLDVVTGTKNLTSGTEATCQLVSTLEDGVEMTATGGAFQFQEYVMTVNTSDGVTLID